jgi:hypothetical protein
MASERPQQVDGAEAGAWIVPALDGDWGGRVKNFVPQIYEAYVRIFHPAADAEGKEVTWAEVARRLGTTAHPEMQWHAIVGSWDSANFTDGRWPGNGPWPGELEVEKLDALCAILAEHTGTPESVYFGLSTINGATAEEWSALPEYKQIHRDWVILHGPLEAVEEIGLSSRHFTFVYAIREGEERPPDWEPPERFSRQSPNLLWPEDRAWFVASEVDFDSTLLGGSRALIEALLASPDLEVLEVGPEISLTEDADKLNPVPDPPPGRREPQDPEVLTRNSFAEQLGMLDGTVSGATVEGGVLAIEVDRGAGDWRIEAAHSDWPEGEVTGLGGTEVERIEVDPETDALRLHLAGGRDFEIAPRPRVGDDPPSWRVHTPWGMRLKHGPGLSFEFPDE